MFSGKLSFSNINKFLKTLSKVFVVCSVLLVVYILIKFFMIRQELSSLELDNSSVSSSQTTAKLIQTPVSFSDYASSVSGRDFFNLPKEKKIVAVKAVEVESPSVAASKNIRVTGLMLTDNPKVLVEKLSTHETIVLSIGDKIDGLVLKNIQKNKLTFDNDGQTVELAI